MRNSLEKKSGLNAWSILQSYVQYCLFGFDYSICICNASTWCLFQFPMLLLFSKLPKLMMNVIIKIDDHHRLNESIGWNYEPATRRMLDGRNSFAQTVLHNKQFSLSITKQFCTTSRVRFVSWTMIWTCTFYIQLGVDVFNTRMHICISKRRYCMEYRIYEIAWMHSIPCLYIYIYNNTMICICDISQYIHMQCIIYI
jgi:hypothetical protein